MSNVATALGFLIGIIASVAWILSDLHTWYAFGWIIIPMLSLIIGLLSEIVWTQRSKS